MKAHTAEREHISSSVEVSPRYQGRARELGRQGVEPDGLSGERIPLASRIILACDAYHTMTSDRPYREAKGAEAALEELRRNAGTQLCSLAPFARS